jgi:hypothetical protein
VLNVNEALYFVNVPSKCFDHAIVRYGVCSNYTSCTSVYISCLNRTPEARFGGQDVLPLNVYSYGNMNQAERSRVRDPLK